MTAKISTFVIALSAMLSFGACTSINQTTVTTPSEQTPMLLNVQENNFIYRNPSFNYQVSYPKGWKMAELKDGEDLVTNAWFDSESVMSADDFGKVDDAPGSIWIYADQGTESIV